VFVEGALPGEEVRARVVQSKKDFARAVVVDVVSASADRVAPPCAALAAGCGGCSWQHVEVGAQARLKVAIVEDALRRIGRFGDGAPPITVRAMPAGERAVRSSARLGVDAATGRAGQHRRGSHEVVPTSSCLAAHPRLAELIVDGRYDGADEVLLRVGVASGERAALGFSQGSTMTASSASFATLPADVVVGPDAVVHESVAGAWLHVSIGSFFQSGPVAAEALVSAVDDAIGDALGAGGHLVDAYAGVGLFGATIGASRRARVTSIESDGSANDDARVNLAELDAVVLEGEVGRWRPELGDPAVDVVCAVPARSRRGRPGVGAQLASGAPRLVLVSCDPASLARDARLLADGGYRCASIALVDAFPDTFHVEAVSRFDRA
jgi:23S rRNA (uracil1939-C5)-methyltransferase